MTELLGSDDVLGIVDDGEDLEGCTEIYLRHLEVSLFTESFEEALLLLLFCIEGCHLLADRYSFYEF